MAEGDFNLATLWLPVAPETSKVGPAMEQAGRDAKGKFGQAIKGIGDTIHDDLTKAGARASDAFHGVGKRITDIFAKAGSDSGKAMAEGLSKVPVAEKVTEPFQKLITTANEANASVRNLGNAFGDLRKGDVSGFLDRANTSIQGIDKSAKDVGVDLSEWAGPLDQVTEPLGKASETANSLGGHVNEATDGIKRMGESGGGLAGLIGKLGEVGVILEAVKGSLHDIESADQWLENKMPWYQHLDEQFKNNPLNSWLNRITGGTPPPSGPTATTDATGAPLFAGGVTSPVTGPGPQYPSNFVGPIPAGGTRSLPPITGPGNPNLYKDWYGQSAPAAPSEPAPSSSGRSSGSSSGYTRPSFNPSVGSRSDLHAAGSRIAYLYQVAQSLEGTPYSKELRNDCSGMVSQLAAAALGLPPPSAGERFTTVNEGQWLFSHGFRPGMGPPGSLQIGWYDHGGGDAGHTAATLPGGEHAESGGSHGNFLVGPGAAGAENSEFEHHAYLPMDGNAPGGLGARPAGSKSDPLYVSSADGGSGGESNGPWESQGQQLGQGLVNGIAEMFGVDGSVFKGFGSGKGILDFGALKLGGGLLNWGMQMGKARMASNGGGGDTSGLPMGGDGISLPGLSMIPGIGNLMPGKGAAISANVAPVGDGNPGGNTTVNIHGDVNSGFNVTQHGVQGSGYQDWKEQYNANSTRTAPLTVPNAGGLPAG